MLRRCFTFIFLLTSLVLRAQIYNLVQNFCESHSISNFSKVSSVDSEKLKQLKCQHPLSNLGFDHSVSLFEAEQVTDDAGT